LSPGTIADKIDGLIGASNDAFIKEIGAVEEALYKNLIVILKGIETDKEGYITQSAGNRRILGEAISAIDESFGDSSAYHQAVADHIQVIPQIDKLNEAYFETISPGFKLNRVFIKNLQKNIISNLETNLLNDGLQVSIKNPLVDILNRNVSVGGSYSGFLQEIRGFILGEPDREAKLLKYSRTYLTDTLFQYARAYQESVTNDLGLDWYNYNGGLIKDSREFCRDRAGGYFHRKEIESWASLDWQGKNPATTKSSIFVLVAGFNCRHSLIPVHISVVPNIDIQRAKDFGFME